MATVAARETMQLMRGKKSSLLVVMIDLKTEISRRKNTSLKTRLITDRKTWKLKRLVIVLYNSGQSYKNSTIVIYDSRVVPDLKIPHIATLDS